MFTFFRKIRGVLLQEGKTSQYFKYAVGEIVLIVIGILIAIQINTWNQDRQKLNRELEIIKALYIEVIQNIESTVDFKEKNQTRLVAIHHLLNITDEDLALVSDEYLHQEIMASAIIDNYTPSISKLNRLLSMEELESDKTKKLVILLYVYSNSIQDIKVENKKTLDIFMEKQIPLFNRNISVKNIMHQRWPEKISASKNVVELKLFVKSLVFENIYADIYATATLTSMYLEKNIQLMQKIIHQIEDNYPVGVIAKSS